MALEPDNLGRLLGLNDGTDVIEVEQYNLNCRTIDNRQRCTCEGLSGYEKVTLLVPVSADDVEACQLTTGVCSETKALEPQGAEDCQRSAETATPTDCTLAIDCSQPGITAGAQVTSLTRVSVGCIHRDDGQWLCSCNEGTGVGPTLSVVADSSASACELGIEDCPSLAPGL